MNVRTYKVKSQFFNLLEAFNSKVIPKRYPICYLRPLSFIFRPLVMLFTQGCSFLIKYSTSRSQKLNSFPTLKDRIMAISARRWWYMKQRRPLVVKPPLQFGFINFIRLLQHTRAKSIGNKVYLSFASLITSISPKI